MQVNLHLQKRYRHLQKTSKKEKKTAKEQNVAYIPLKTKCRTGWKGRRLKLPCSLQL